MINISNIERRNPILLDEVVRIVLPSAVGVSTGPYGTLIHLPDGVSVADQALAQTVLSNVDSLSVSADKTVMNEGDADPVVTCSDASISGDSDVNYLVLLDGEVYASGTTTVTAGVATLNLVSPVDGVYEIFMYRTTGDYASGSVTITVSEV